MRSSAVRTLRWATPLRPSWSRCFTVARQGAGPALHARSPSPRVPPQRYFSGSSPAQSIFDADSTIYALSTASGRAAIAVVRASGPACVQIYKSLCPEAPLPRPRLAVVRTLYDPFQKPSPNTVLDAGALVLYFPGPKTVTGEDVLELHLHGGPAIVKSVLTAISRTNNSDYTVRYAEPGEFTRRAFMNNRLDLPQIEALGDTLSADTEQQRRLAVRGASDALSKRYEQWRHQLLYARGELEALIDFSEDQHFDESTEDLVSSVAAQVRALRAQIALHIQNASKGELLRNGIKVALLGAPNAGKSSLLNRIVGREAAIVSTEEGTTRDIVDVGVDIGGWYCKLGDMAGIRSEPNDPTGQKKTVVIGAVEQEGIRRAKARALESDVVIVVVSVEEATDGAATYRLAVEQEVVDAANDCARAGKCVVVTINKCDRLPEGKLPPQLIETVSQLFEAVPDLRQRIFGISCLDATNGLNISSPGSSQSSDPGYIQQFLQGLMTTFEEIASPTGIDGDENGQYDHAYWEDSLGVTHRQSSNLQRCLEHLDDFLTQTQPQSQTPLPSSSRQIAHEYPETDMDMDIDIVTAAEHLRSAADTMAKITGRGESGDVEDVLGVVFEKFCVGK
ncbi:tRNA modification GTPase [Aspergillus neoniger CBS 115656]|uniref:P-loop containing nucleoside triphosphate hydrolase protein n=1 Tax=Aspergillus neoniger (strain CBS 115656) TaxID=1448310 RepID=A0A318Y5D3_ASPNB|nr:P-loop containing nucleoside triphosphate hydrolase protein [Aspergillus neoniger CBS 115656]PYH28677.1 P-loop containing nucleoside triphosphate hydrolase protein [Aspergillus neoniger CBS 115656]